MNRDGRGGPRHKGPRDKGPRHKGTPAAAAVFLASGFGSGFLRPAPGSWGSLVGLGIGAACLAASPIWLEGFAMVASLAGLPLVVAATGLPWRGCRPDMDDDPGWIVWDEIAGQAIALLALARPTAIGLALAFALFRLFDIWKPGPIGWADRQGGAFGIMLDDILAGALAAALIYAARLWQPGAFT